MKRVVISGGFDDLRFLDFRFLDAARQRGDSLHAQLWSDDAIKRAIGKPPKFPLVERQYFLNSIRWIDSVAVSDGDAPKQLDDSIVVTRADFSDAELQQAPPAPVTPMNPPGKKVVVTGCFDWFHSGHVRFFEECSQFGDLYVVVGNDPNLLLLKGEGHPLFPAVQRRYICGAVRFVKECLISSAMGWMDAEPEFQKIKPDIYAVNEDGDKPEKRDFCDKYGIEYKVLKRAPKEGLPKRQSTALRGF